MKESSRDKMVAISKKIQLVMLEMNSLMREDEELNTHFFKKDAEEINRIYYDFLHFIEDNKKWIGMILLTGTNKVTAVLRGLKEKL